MTGTGNWEPTAHGRRLAVAGTTTSKKAVVPTAAKRRAEAPVPGSLFRVPFC